MKKILATLCVSSLVAALVAEDAYIQSDGSQAIDTGYFATPATRVDIDFAYDDLTVQQRPFGDQGVDAGLTFASYISGGSFYSWGCKDGDGDWIWSNTAVSRNACGSCWIPSPASTRSTRTVRSSIRPT